MVNADRPSILDLASSAVRPGIEPPTPRWAATLAYLYGLPLSEQDVDLLAGATRRTHSAIRDHAAELPSARRFRQLWCRIGRRGRKSSTSALIVVFEAIFGGHEAHIMPGEQAIAAVISKDLAGASVVTRFVKLYLDALGFKYESKRIGSVSVIEIDSCPIAIATLAAVSEAPRGFAICCLVLDEFAHVSSDDEHVDTDRSILTGAEPAMTQFPDALVVGISTGFGRSGIHYERVERGLGNDQEREILAVTGASWDWSRNITPERARQIADGDPDVMLTEFEGGVSENEALWMPQTDALAMFEPREGHYLWRAPFMVCDFAESGDTLAWCVAAWGDPDPQTYYRRRVADPSTGLLPDTFVGWEVDPDGQRIPFPKPQRPLLHIFRIGGFDGPEVRRLGMNDVIQQLGRIAIEEGAQQVIGDDRGGPYISALFSRFSAQDAHWLQYSFVHYANRKHDAAMLCRSWARDRQILIEPHDEMRKQCLRYRRYVSGASFKYGKAGERDDFVCLLITLAVSLLRSAEEYTQSPPDIPGAPTQRFFAPRKVVAGR
jgi:hypothetical protein